MTGERHAASLLDVIAFLPRNLDVGLPLSRMLLWLGSADLPQGSITPRCPPHEDSFNEDMPINRIQKKIFVLQFANKCFSPERPIDLICNGPRFPIPSNSLAPETEVHGTIILTQRTPALHDPNHLGYPGNQYSLGNLSNQSDIKAISDQRDMINKLKQRCWLSPMWAVTSNRSFYYIGIFCECVKKSAIEMPQCQVHDCKLQRGHRNAKGVSFFRIPDGSKPELREIAQRWLHFCGTGYDARTFNFTPDKIVCEHHFTSDCFVDDAHIRMARERGEKPKHKCIRPGSVPTIVSQHRQTYDAAREGRAKAREQKKVSGCRWYSVYLKNALRISTQSSWPN